MRRLGILIATMALTATMAPPVAAHSRTPTHYSWPNTGSQTFDWPGGFCGATSVTMSGSTEEWDAPRVGNTVGYTLFKKWKNVFSGPSGSVTVRVHDVVVVKDVINPDWDNYIGHSWWMGTPQSSTVTEVGVIWSMVASDGARLRDSGTAVTNWTFAAPGWVDSEKAIALHGRLPITRGGFDPSIGTWTVGCQFFMDHLG
jgi:hypothetical protein